MVSLRPLAFVLLASCFGLTSHAIAGDEEHLIQLLGSRQCPACQLNDVDLTHADLRDANLKDAELQRANLSQARLDGADLSGSDLSFTSLQGASLRGADLRNSRLIGTDLRRTDLTGALLAPMHWTRAIGLEQGVFPKTLAATLNFTMQVLMQHRQGDGLRLSKCLTLQSKPTRVNH